jgi:hypothetical protein
MSSGIDLKRRIRRRSSPKTRVQTEVKQARINQSATPKNRGALEALSANLVTAIDEVR